MKTNRYLSFCMVVLTSALLAGMVSCKKEKGPSELRAVMNDFATSGQKAYIDPEQYSCFVVGEKVRVNNSTGTITALERNDRQCVISGVAGLPEVTSFRAFYPAELLTNPNADLSSGLNNVAVTLPQEQVYEKDANGNQIIKNPMMAELTGANENKSTLHFRNLCALLKITVRTQEAFDRITVSCDGMKLSGSGKINTSSGIIVMDNGSNSSVSLKLPGTHVGSPAGECFYIMIPEARSHKGNRNFSVKILKGNTQVKEYNKSVKDQLLPANQIHTIGNFTFNAPVFSVSSSQRVVFSLGNLQWSANAGGMSHSTATTGYNGGTWRFAEHQYDYVGADNENVSSTCSTWVDLFGWGTSGNNNSRPYDLSSHPTIYSNLSNTNYYNFDWGRFNTIYNPKTKTNDPYGTWRTLTKDEWHYLLNDRNGWTCSNISIPIGSKLVYGLLIYPDGFAKPESINSELYSMSISTRQVYPITKKEYDTLESHGCVFLPAAGDMLSSPSYQVQNDNNNGFYWTATAYSSNAIYLKTFKGGAPTLDDNSSRSVGHSVRLARNVKE